MAKVIPSKQAAASKVMVTFLVLLAAVLASAEESTIVEFVRDVQPILQAACFKCHGPEKQSGQLRLDGRAFAFKGGISGPVIVPGDAGASPLVKLLENSDPEERMPRKSEPLRPEQIAL